MLANDIDNAGEDEPRNLEEAMKSPYWPQWLEAMKREFNSLIKNEVWELVNIPLDRKVLTGRWVFKLKKDRNGKILKFKVRWVVHGYKQKYGVDYEETFASVAKPMSWKSLLAISALRRLKIHQMDVVTAFLYGFLDQIIFIEQPHQLHDGAMRVCRLRKSLYGLKQAPRVWYETLTDFLTKLGLRPSQYDPAIFMTEDKQLFVSIYVDDLLIFTADLDRMSALKDQLSRRFEMTNMGCISQYLGMEADVTNESITLRQVSYIRKILDRFGMSDSSPVKTPMEQSFITSVQPNDGQSSESVQRWYQSAIGSPMWPALHTRPDILYAVVVLAKYNNNPGPQHIDAVKRVLKYLKGTLELGISYKSDGSTSMVGYSDSDWGGQIDGRKSTGGYVFMLAGGPISHSSK